MTALRLRGSIGHALLIAAVASLPGRVARAADNNVPHLQKQGTATQLIVDGKPFLILGAAAADPAKPEAWTRLKALNANTAITPVTWSAIEPKEGQFDFRSIDALLKDAQTNKLHVIIQWSGATTGTPVWFKSDPKSLGDDVAAADAKAFAALLKHIAGTDAAHTVIAAQVEGKLTGPSDAAKAAAGKPEVGFAGDESARAAFAGKVAAAGKAAFALPLYLVCETDKPEDAAAFLAAVRSVCPAIDFIAPAIHSGNFAPLAAKFTSETNPLFIAEANGGATGAANLLYAFGKYNAIGAALPDVPNAAPDAATPAFFATVAGMAPALLDNQGKDTLHAFMFGPGSPDEAAQQEVAMMGPFALTVRASAPAGGNPGGRGGGSGRGGGGGGAGAAIGTSTTLSGIVIAIKPYEYLALHSGLNIAVAPTDRSLGAFALGFQETGNFIEGKWVRYARTNGDENDHDRRADGALNGRWTNLHVAFYQRP